MAETSSLQQRLQRVIRQDVQSTHGYAIQPSAGLIKLDAMENPFRLPLPLQRELGERLSHVAINRYPVQSTADVVAALSRHVELPTGCKLMLGNGSDELIDMLSVACNVAGASILAPEPGFVMYRMSAQLRGLRFIGVPLTAEFELDRNAMHAAIERERPALTYIAYPNNPTCNLWDDAVIDEVEKVRPPYNISVLNAEATLFALDHADEYARQATVLRGERERLQAAFRAMPGVRAYPSEANMILVRVPDAQRAFDGMKARGVLVKNIGAALGHPLLANCLRLTVGAPEENTQMIDALKASL